MRKHFQSGTINFKGKRRKLYDTDFPLSRKQKNTGWTLARVFGKNIFYHTKCKVDEDVPDLPEWKMKQHLPWFDRIQGHQSYSENFASLPRGSWRNLISLLIKLSNTWNKWTKVIEGCCGHQSIISSWISPLNWLTCGWNFTHKSIKFTGCLKQPSC